MLIFTGLSHQHTPLELRERCAVPTEQRDRARSELARMLGNAVLLSTCCRIEIYADVGEGGAGEAEGAIEEWLARRAGGDTDRIAAYVDHARDEEAVRRVVRVACGLESALEGE